MKKYLILLVTLLTSLIFCVSNVSAFEVLDSSITPGKDNFLQQIKFINTYSMSDEEIRELVSLYESNTAYQTTNITSSTVEEYLEKKNWIDNNKSNLGNYFLSNNYLNYNINFNNFKAYINSTFASSTDKSYYPLGYYGNIRLHLSFGVNTYYYDWKSSSKTFTRNSYPQTSDIGLSSYNLLSKTILNAIYVYFYECNFESNFIIDSTPSRLNNVGSSYNDGFNYKDKILYPGDIIEETTLTGFNFIDLGPKIYKYEDEIDTSNLSYIKINYNTTGSTYDDYSFVVMDNVSSKLKEAYFEKSYDWGICLDENTCYDKYVYRDNLYYTKEVNMYSASFPFKIEDSNHGYYDETQELDYFYAYYDVSSISDIVTLSIDSTKEFSVELGYMEDYVDTFVEIDLKKYAGIVLFPKVNLYNGDYVFYLKNADVNVHHYYENNLVNIYKNIIVETYRIDQVEYQDRNRYYLIENNKVDQNSYISFDTRYFSYQLVNTTSETITITNPNTNEDQNISSIDSSNLDYDISHKLDNVDSLVERVGIFIDSMKEYISIISELFDCAYSNLNSDCQLFIVVIFIIILIVGLILLLRR